MVLVSAALANVVVPFLYGIIFIGALHRSAVVWLQFSW